MSDTAPPIGELVRRRLGAVIAVVVVVVFLSATRITSFLTELWWFDSLGFREVFTGILGTRILLGVVFGVVLASIVALNLVIVRRVRPLIIPSTPQQAIVERYRQMVDPYLPWVIAGIAVLFGLTAGGAVSGEWRSFLLWRNGVPFGVEDPQFGADIGFYMFDLPWYQFVQAWLFTSLVLVTLLTAGAHYLLGGIRPESRTDKVLPAVKVHLSALVALLLGVYAWGLWLERFGLNFSPRGVVTGASYTDVNAELPALNLLIGVTALAIVLILISLRRGGWVLPGAAIAILILGRILLSGIYPAVIQQLRVDPQELQREHEYITRNREATSTALGLEAPLNRFDLRNTLAEEDIDEEAVTLENIRLWDETVLSTTYEELQALRPYYKFEDVDVDRYLIDGEIRQVVMATRELDPANIPQGWQSSHLIFTHAFGLVASAVNTADEQGQPEFLSQDIPPQGVEELVPDVEAGIYFGEVPEPAYSLVNTDQPELDFEDPETGEQNEVFYEGSGGVPIGGFLRKIAFGLRFADANFVLSDLLNPDSRVIWDRDVRTRVQKAAPYLSLDSDPYPVVLDGRIVWIQDAYTTSAMYPYSQRVGPAVGRDMVNYVRNSVKAVVDAYSGEVTLYVIDPEDPVLQTWRNAFPESFTDLSEAPERLTAHFRYPEDLFDLQAFMYRTYHIPTTDGFYNQGDAWDIPRDAPALANNPGLSEANARLEPYYLLMRLPGEEREEFVLIQPYTARGRPNMIGWLAGRSDPEHYGELVAFQFPSTRTVLGPQQVQARIEQESRIAEYITLRSEAGSTVIRGNLVILPIDDSLLYVEPLFIQGDQSDIPELNQVVVVMGNQVVMRPTLAGAIAELVGAEPPEDEPTEPGPDDGDDGEATIDALLARMDRAFEAAEQALREGDLATYQARLREASQLLQRVLQQRGLEQPAEEPDGETTPDDEASPAEEGSPAPEPTPTG